MAWAVPTPDDLVLRFPAFQGVDTDVAQTALDEAALRVDDTWVSEGNFRLGYMLYAAHVLTMDGHGTGGEAETIKGVRRFKSGTFEVEQTADAAGANGVLSSTSYGRRFLELVRLNHPAVAIV